MSALIELVGDFDASKPIWAGMDMHLALESILSGRSAGRVFVDRAVEPRGALACTGHRVYLAGNVEGFGNVIRREYLPTHPWFVAYLTPETIESAASMMPGKVTRRARCYYESDPSARIREFEPPEGFTVERITGGLLERGLVHTDRVREEMCSERESVEEFLEKSFGFAVVHDGGFAAWCMSEYNLDDRCEVGIETVKEYRRRGLAALVACAMFRHASSVGVRRVGWHCWADNAGSVATAERLGLRRVTEYPALLVDARVG